MSATAIKSKYYSHNGAYGIVMRGVQKMNTRVHRYEGTNFKSLQRINLDTATDQACGTGGMLSTSYNFIKRYNPSADVRLFGQEVNPESYAMCLAEMLIKGQNAENICYQDTMKADRFETTRAWHGWICGFYRNFGFPW